MDKNYISWTECKITFSGLFKILNTLSIPWSSEIINDDIIHMIVWRSGKRLIFRFQHEYKGYGDYVFTGILGDD